MANSTTTMITSIGMIMLFTVAILGFSIGFANDNEAAIRIDDHPDINSMNIYTQTNLSTFEKESIKTYDSIVNSTIEAGSDVIKSPQVFTITWLNIIGVLGNIMLVTYEIIFGSGGSFAIFVTTFMTIIGILFTFYIIKAWRGNP